MFSHIKQFQYNAQPNAPDPIFAKPMQELLAGQWGEMSVMNGHLFQGFNCRETPNGASHGRGGRSGDATAPAFASQRNPGEGAWSLSHPGRIGSEGETG